jgi:hypothetical protein
MKTIILPDIVYAFQNLYVGVFGNRLLRREFGPKWEEMAGSWRKPHNEELHNLYTSLSIIRVIKPRRMRWTKHIAGIGEMRNSYKIFGGKIEGRRPLGRLRRRWEDYIRTDLRGIRWQVVD